ncbi:hypothetical protein [Haloarchaeobius sp. HRN-SO-5]|uniref:hypothetical protein n=1 Tax=Haloarchaeobius sp. HRN-SO-5 TaxID=3446118 RepID=UPI003EBE2F57
MIDSQRRTIIAGALTVVAGCMSIPGSDSQATQPRTENPRSTPTRTPTSTPTATPTTEQDTRPEVVLVNLVSDYQEYGDAEDNRISSAEVGDEINIAFRFRLWSHDRVAHNTNQVRVYGPAGGSVSVATWDDRQLVDWSGSELWENYAWFDTTGWEAGEYTAEVLIRDEVTGEVSDPETTTFDMEQPTATQSRVTVHGQG